MAEQRGETADRHRAGDGVGSGFRAFLISDIRGYSSFASVRGDEAAAALTERFVALAHVVMSQFGGESIGTRGDEVLFAFESPRNAIRAAVSFEQALLDATREDPTLPMPAGVGIDVGEAVVVSDGWRANAINVAARLCAIARGGEILATPQITHLAQAIDGIRYASRPRTHLKGIAAPVSPVRVVADGLDTVRGFADLGLARAETPPARRWRPRRLLAVALAVVAGAAVLVGTVLAGGSSSVRLDAAEIGAIDTGSGAVTMALPIGSSPTGVAVGKDGAIWVTSASAGTLSRIDPNTHAVRTITVGSEPTAVALDPNPHGSVWVANSGDGTVSRVNPETDSVVATVAVGAGPTALATTAHSVWVANTLGASVTEIALQSAHVVRTIAVGSGPAGITVGGGSVWVADQGDGNVYRLDEGTGTPTAPIPVGSGPTGIAFGDGAAWVVNSVDGTLSRIDAQANSVTTNRVGPGPVAVAVGADHVWVSDEYGNAIKQVNPATLTVTNTTPTNSAPLGLALAGSRLWVATDGSGATAHRGGVLYAIADVPSEFPQDIPAIDPGSAYTTGLWRILVMTSDGLVGYRKAGGVAGSTLVPDLAASLPVPTDQGLTYTFHVRVGIRYSNGTPVRATDFRRGLERSFKVGGGPVQYFTSLIGGQRCMKQPASCDLSRGVVADDAANTVTFQLSGPDPELLNQLTLPAAYPVPPGTPVQLPVGGSVPGTGPYEIAQYSPVTSNNSQVHGRLILKRNPYFHQWSAAAQPSGFPDQIVVRTNYSPQDEVTAVEEGRADFVWDLPPATSLPTLTQTYPSQLHQSPQSQTTFLWLNVRGAPFDSVLARRALNYAIDRNALATLTPGGLPGRPTCQLLPPNFPGYVPYCPYTVSPSASGRWVAPDLSDAQMLVHKSGTFGAHVILLTYTGTAQFPGFDTARANAVIATLDAIGYRAHLRVVPFSVYYGPNQPQLSNQVQVGIFPWFADYVSPSSFLDALVECGQAGTNVGRFCDPGLDARIKKVLTDESLQAGVASQEWAAIDHSLVDAAVDVPLSNSLAEDFVSRRVGDYQYNPQWGVLLDQLWVR